MDKKRGSKKKKTSAKKGAAAAGITISLKALHAELASIMTTLNHLPTTPASAAMKRGLQAMQLIADCGQSMEIDI